MRYVIAILALVSSFSAHAVSNDNIDNVQAKRMSLGAANIAGGPLLNGIYRVSEDTPILPRQTITNGKTAWNSELFQIYKNQPFAVRLISDKAYLTAIVPDEARGQVPETYIFSRRDLETTGLIYVMDGDAKFLNSTFTAEANTEVAAGHCKALVERHFGFHAGGRCASSLTAGVLAGVGFHSTDCGSAQMKVWAKRGGCGHVAWKTGGGGWSSGDFAGDPGRKYVATGCYSHF